MLCLSRACIVPELRCPKWPFSVIPPYWRRYHVLPVTVLHRSNAARPSFYIIFTIRTESEGRPDTRRDDRRRHCVHSHPTIELIRDCEYLSTNPHLIDILDFSFPLFNNRSQYISITKIDHSLYKSIGIIFCASHPVLQCYMLFDISHHVIQMLMA